MMRVILSFACFALFYFTNLFQARGQAIISGVVIDSVDQAGIFANVVIKDETGTRIISYTNSDERGNYRVLVNQIGTFRIYFSCLSYRPKSLPIRISSMEEIITVNVELELLVTELNEIIVRDSRATEVRGDTVIFNTKAFASGGEDVVEDLLKKLPGFTVDATGTIRVGNQEVEKVMVEGDDFFERGYKILTKNMPVSPIEKVELLRNYSPNQMLKGVEYSEKIALNLKLNDEAKRIWFGNAAGSYDVNSWRRFEARGNLMNFGKQNKYYFLTNLNNVGYDATGEINELINPYRANDPGSLGDGQRIERVVAINSESLNFKASRTNFNNSKLLSLNAIHNPSEKIKVKTLGLFHGDRIDFYSQRIDNVSTGSVAFRNSTFYQLITNRMTGYGKVEVSYSMSPRSMMDVTASYRQGDDTQRTQLYFNDSPNGEHLHTPSSFSNQKIVFSNKINDHKAFLFTTQTLQEKSSQQYQVDRFIFQDLFPDQPTAEGVQQQIGSSMRYAGAEAHYFDRLPMGLLEFKAGSSYRKDELQTLFSLLESDNSPTPTYKNNVVYISNDLFFKSKYRYEIGSIGVTTNLDVHYLINSLNTNEAMDKQRKVFVNPAVGFDWTVSKKSRITSSYTYNTANATVLDVHPEYILKGFRSFARGTGDFNQLNASTLLINYQLGSWSEETFLNASVIHVENHDFFSSNIRVEQNYLQSDRILIKDRSLTSFSTSVDRFISGIASNFKMSAGFSQTEYINKVNNSSFRNVTSRGYQGGMELRSSFAGAFNFHVGTKWTSTVMDVNEVSTSFTNNLSFADISFLFSNKMSVQLQTEQYYFATLTSSNKYYYFVDVEARYTIKANKWIASISGKNLLNSNRFIDLSLNDTGNSVAEYQLLPRFILLKLEFRF